MLTSALASATARAYERCRRDEARVVDEMGGQCAAAGGRPQSERREEDDRRRGEERRGSEEGMSAPSAESPPFIHKSVDPVPMYRILME